MSYERTSSLKLIAVHRPLNDRRSTIERLEKIMDEISEEGKCSLAGDLNIQGVCWVVGGSGAVEGRLENVSTNVMSIDYNEMVDEVTKETKG